MICSEQNPSGFLPWFCPAIKIPGWPWGLTAKTPTSARNRTLRKEKIHIAEEKANGNKILGLGSQIWAPVINQPETLSKSYKQPMDCLSSLTHLDSKGSTSTSFQMSHSHEILDLEERP